MSDFTPRPQPQQVTNVTQVFNEPTPVGAQWNFQGTTGDCEPGKFVTNTLAMEDTTFVEISSINSAGSDSSYIRQIAVGNILRFTDSVGKTAAYRIESMVPDESGCNLIGVTICRDQNLSDVDWGDWAGLYLVDAAPGSGA